MDPDAAGFEVVSCRLEALSLPAGFVQAMSAGPTQWTPPWAGWPPPAAPGRRSARSGTGISFRLAGDRLRSRSPPTQGAESVTQAVVAAGGEVTGSANEDTWLQAWPPLTALNTLVAEADVEYIGRPAEAEPMATTEGLAVINAPAWHNTGLRGAGVKWRSSTAASKAIPACAYRSAGRGRRRKTSWTASPTAKWTAPPSTGRPVPRSPRHRARRFLNLVRSIPKCTFRKL